MTQLFLHELKYNIKNIYQYTYIYGFYLIVLLVRTLTVPAETLDATSHVAFLWIAVIFGSLLLASRAVEEDYRTGYIDQLRLSAGNLEGYLFCKITVLFLLGGLPALILLPLLELNHLAFILPVTMILHFAVLALTVMMSSLMAGINGARLILGIIMIPWLAPLLIFADDAVGGALAFSGNPGLWLLCGLSGLLFSVALWLGAAAMKE